MRIKICGLTREVDVLSALGHGADYLGFILAARSPRCLSFQRACELAQLVGDKAKTVAVVDRGDPRITALIEGPFAVVQIHGGLDERIPRARQLPVYGVGDEFIEGLDDPGLKIFETQVGGTTGGTGRGFDLGRLSQATRPYFVAGGINADRLETITTYELDGLDVSSGLESAPGIKCSQKIESFMDRARSLS